MFVTDPHAGPEQLTLLFPEKCEAVYKIIKYLLIYMNLFNSSNLVM